MLIAQFLQFIDQQRELLARHGYHVKVKSQATKKTNDQLTPCPSLNCRPTCCCKPYVKYDRNGFNGGVQVQQNQVCDAAGAVLDPTRHLARG
ncbi:hypothetical protein [Deinococcus peraridilitoris]|uniref:hypothetical protein n=1 Tax=Deinococcus peraridilitoris TaxID=432329 RepID=UPI00145F12DB|nr:hypothetical protein [Deinococcus peraridilitoris]